MIKAHKIRLHPTPEQETYFAKAGGTHRFTFNWALAEGKQQNEQGGKPSALALKKQFQSIRKEQFPWTYDVSKSVIEGAFMDVAAAFKNFFAGLGKGPKRGYPKFKSKKRVVNAFYLANDRFMVGDHWVEIAELGRVNMAENLRFSGKILAARISKTACWWFISITVQMPDEMAVNPHPPVGLDAGLNRFLHKLTTEIATTASLVGVEHLHVKGLMQNRKLALSFSDAALGRLLRLLESKVLRRGGTMVKVDRFYPSSQLCHKCGWRWHEIGLADRVFVCQNAACGWLGDRDYNAALNILQEALRLVGLIDRAGAGSGYDGTLNSPVDLR